MHRDSLVSLLLRAIN
jgi:hypothetical protein